MRSVHLGDGSRLYTALENGTGNQDLGARFIHCYWDIIASRNLS